MYMQMNLFPESREKNAARQAAAFRKEYRARVQYTVSDGCAFDEEGRQIDGWLFPQERRARPTVLFVLKESGDPDLQLLPRGFWFRDIVGRSDAAAPTPPRAGLRRKDKIARTRYFNCLRCIGVHLLGPAFSWASAAYINLNKIGGGSLQQEGYKDLADDQWEAITAQIRQIDADYVVCLGLSPDNTFERVCRMLGISRAERQRGGIRYGGRAYRYARLEEGAYLYEYRHPCIAGYRQDAMSIDRK